MFARLSRTCSQLADFSWNASSHDSNEVDDEHGLYDGSDLLPPEASALSVPEDALKTVTGVADACGKMFSPLYRYVESTLSADVERLVLSLHKADPDFSADSEDEGEDIYVIPFPPSDVPASSPLLPLEESTMACEGSLSNSLSTCGRGVAHVSESHAPQKVLVPRIVITPAPLQQFREMSSCVPVQDTSFGARLTVPAHTALNACHPPMTPTSYPHAPSHAAVHTWTYRQGHWCAVLPCLEEQERRGIFSRPINLRRRAMRKRSGNLRDHPVSCQNLFARSKRDS